MKFCLIFLCLIATVVCGRHGRGSYIDAIEKCNGYIDKLLVTSVNKSNLEDYPVYGRELIFYKRVIFYNFKVNANFTEGHITGFGNLRRKSPCAFSFENGRIKLNAQIETREIKCNFTASVNVIGSPPNVSVEAITTPLKIDLSFTFDATTGSNGFLDLFRPHVISDMSTSVNGLGYLDYVKEPLKEHAETLFFDLINMLTHINLRNALAFGVKEISFPVKELEDDDISSTEPTKVMPLTTPEGRKVFTKEDSDSYIDTVLGNRFIVESKYSKLDPHALNDVRLEGVFLRHQEHQEGDQNYVKLEKGSLENLSKLKRCLHCSAPEFKETNVTFSCNLGFDELEMKYVAEARNDTQIYNFNLVTTILRTLLTVNVTSNYNDNVPTVQEYSVKDIGKVTIKAAIDIVGGPLRSPSAIETLYNSKVILEYFSNEINNVLKGRLKEVLSYSIYKTPLPFLEY